MSAQVEATRRGLKKELPGQALQRRSQVSSSSSHITCMYDESTSSYHMYVSAQAMQCRRARKRGGVGKARRAQ